MGNGLTSACRFQALVNNFSGLIRSANVGGGQQESQGERKGGESAHDVLL
jgi:hypothetical protein